MIQIVELNYTAREMARNEVVDTTIEDVAVKEGIFSAKAVYKPAIVVLGERELPEPIEKAVSEMKVKEEKTIVLSPKDAFGERQAGLVAVVPLREFTNRKIKPVPGLMVDLNGQLGKVQSVSGGRVRVDFNHPLAGKEIEYTLRLEKVMQKPQELLDALFEKYFSRVPEKEKSIEQKGNIVEVKLDGKTSQNLATAKKLFAEKTMQSIEGIQKVVFIEDFSKTEKQAKN